jgi:hypothetical protein
VQYSCDGRAKGETLGHGPASVSGREMGDWPAASIGNGRATAHASINAAGASSAEVKLRARDAAAGGVEVVVVVVVVMPILMLLLRQRDSPCWLYYSTPHCRRPS